MSFLYNDPDRQVDSEEFDFSALFDNSHDEDFATKDAEHVACSHNDIVSSGIGYSTMDAPHYGPQSCNSVTSAVLTEEHLSEYGHVDNREFKYYLEPAKPPASSGVESPRIEITPSPGLFYAASHPGGPREQYSPVASRSTLPVPGPENNAYRDPFSPASSASSTSCHSYVSHEYGISPQTSPVTSPCVSPKNGGSNEHQVQAPHHSPRTSPANSPTTHIENWHGPRSPSPSPRQSSRSSSPIGKRRYSCDRSRTPSPQASPRVITRDEPTFHPCSNASLAEAMSTLTTDSNNDSGEIWGKARIVDLPPPTSLKTDMTRSEKHPMFSMTDFLEIAGTCHELKKDIYNPETVFLMPPHPLHWSKPKPLCGIASLPPLEWQLPCQSGQYELEIEVQPKPHHRAHYETEGSRGAVKSPSGCHPVVQLHGYVDNKPLSLQIFIGTADDRLLRPHAFYQVHRITGKTVSTTSYEKICGNTKVLEIPLLPENNMKAIIDCAGILKLRNADIELRKGETDIGRKNTRVRLVFRVHIPQPNGMFVSLQAASNPIECSQRSAHELPMVEKHNIDSCLVMGGQQMILNGQNFTPESKVLFTEKTHDGQQMWEVEATVDKDKSQPNILFVEIPRYQNQLIHTPAKVSFCVVNGKRKKSQPQRFTYLPAVPIIKTEPSDECEATLIHSAHREAMSQLYYASQGMTPVMVGDPTSSYGAPCRPGVSPPDSRYQQHNPSGAMYQRCKSGSPSQLGYQSSPVMVSSIPTIQDGHRSVLVHPGSPGQPGMLHHSPVNQSSIMIHHSSNNQHSSSMLHNSPTHHQSSMIQHSPNSQQLLPMIHHSPNSQQLRYCSHQDYQHQVYLENDAHVPTVQAATPQAAHHMQRNSPTHYPAVIQQQHSSHAVQKTSKNGPSPSQLASLTLAQQESEKEAISTEVTVKQEPQNLDQAYLDDVNEIIRKDLSGITARGQS
ncbi:nuclear factor of activated T-cells, cytoplasmic 2 isoform X2 [Callorhinchus milii]|uniref:RHD domain-containing protein n=1 Tax=Callorhinchus milii TaxID=7868 RepID=A0A4W3IXF1_CALMI|nr:nuclear factor of activated T-cells, cytoplasmic 2 isoform X2 [Callorhinchus milii]|eukprot:gi/632939462/ref/XP_007910151.1/ PREDICTED: nuclear factor of activated T-cells, cytoplasmic 2 isoform X2 [Callorhinchus milii]